MAGIPNTFEQLQPNTNDMFYHYDTVTGREARIALTQIGNFSVTLTDTDQEVIRAIRIFDRYQFDEALAYAKRYVGLE